jgi:hypothetical protein
MVTCRAKVTGFNFPPIVHTFLYNPIFWFPNSVFFFLKFKSMHANSDRLLQKLYESHSILVGMSQNNII